MDATCGQTAHSLLGFRDSSTISTGVAVLLMTVTTPVRALVQTGEPPNLAREGDPIGLTAGGFAHPRPPFGPCPRLTAMVTGRAICYPVEIPEDSLDFSHLTLANRGPLPTRQGTPPMFHGRQNMGGPFRSFRSSASGLKKVSGTEKAFFFDQCTRYRFPYLLCCARRVAGSQVLRTLRLDSLRGRVFVATSSLSSGRGLG